MGKVNKKIGKKGIFFTLITIAIVSIFILMFTPQADISVKIENQAVKKRISSVDNYVNDLENRYFESVLRASTYKTILSLVLYVDSSGRRIDDVDSAFYEVIMTEKINGVPIDSITGKKIMGNNTLINWSNRIVQTAFDTLNVNTTINITNVSIFQTGPWRLNSVLNVTFLVKSEVAEWKKSIKVGTSISIEGLQDPYFLMNTNPKYSRQINRSSVEFDQWNISRVREHLRNGTYTHWENSDAPSFLMRLANKTTNSSCCGIESLIGPNKVQPNDQIESYVDYYFWTHKYTFDNCTQLYNITGLWDEFRYFKLDIQHAVQYNINLSTQDAVRSC